MKRVLLATGALAVILATAASDGELTRQFRFAGEGIAATCRGSIVELEFDPEGHIEARADATTVAVAAVSSGELKYDVCENTGRPREFSQGGISYATLTTRTTLTCRFPDRFVVTLSPLSPSWAGERPAGNSVSLVLGRRIRQRIGPQRTILASARVLERAEESSVMFVREFCTASSS